MRPARTLPWHGENPVMLAPMQGLTNRVLRGVMAGTGPTATSLGLAAPDVLFTEFVRVRARHQRGKRDAAPALIAKSDFAEATTTHGDVPLVVQVIGALDDGVVEATQALIDRGVQHINVNMGCPWGRMTSVLAGGGMFKHPDTVLPLLKALRAIVPGSLSVKTRAGLEAPDELFAVLDAFHDADIDFLVLHPRCVRQKYRGIADHSVTRAVIERCTFPVVANGDMNTAADVARVRDETGAAGIMLGRGAIADPWLFARVQGKRGPRPDGEAWAAEVAAFLTAVLAGYKDLFCGDAQVLAKLREVLAHQDAPAGKKWLKALKKQKTVAGAEAVLASARGAAN